jgi:integrase
MKMRDGLYKRGKIFWAKFYINGVPMRESTGATTHAEAKRFRDARVGKVALGEPILRRADRIAWDEAAQDLRVFYATTGKRDLAEAETRLRHLAKFFAGRRLVAIDGAIVNDYAQQRQASGVTNATINRETATLKRGLRLAHRNNKLARLPVIDNLAEGPPRAGFFEADAFEAVVRRLPEHLALVARIAYACGWRHGEVLALERRHVDLVHGTIRLDPGFTKNGDGRVAYLSAELVALLRAQLERVDALQRTLGRVIPTVFCHMRGYLAGRPIQEFSGTWKTACRQAGVPGMLFHDLRRTAVRNFERAGVPRSVAMKITGHRSERVYRRYAIVSDVDLQDAARRLALSAAATAGTIPGTIAGNPSAKSSAFLR